MASTLAKAELEVTTNLLTPIYEKLTQLQRVVEYLEVVDNPTSESHSYTNLIKSAKGTFVGDSISHHVLIVAHLIRLIISNIAKFEDIETLNGSPISTNLYEEGILKEDEIMQIMLTVNNPKLVFSPPTTFTWTGTMSKGELNELLTKSNHPFWRTMIFELHKYKGAEGTASSAERKLQLLSYFNQRTAQFTIACSVDKLVEDLYKVFQKYNSHAHDIDSNSPVSGYLNKEISVPPIQYTQFIELLGDTVRIFNNLQVKPVIKLQKIKSIITA